MILFSLPIRHAFVRQILRAGVRTLRGQPEQKIREWVGRFCAMGWLEPEEGKPGVPPKAWLVHPALRQYFAKRRQEAQAAKAEAHAILKAGGSRRTTQGSSDKSPCAHEPSLLRPTGSA